MTAKQEAASKLKNKLAATGAGWTGMYQEGSNKQTRTRMTVYMGKNQFQFCNVFTGSQCRPDGGNTQD